LRLLLDTHILLWWLSGNRRLSESARNAIASSVVTFVSAVSAWEIGIKVAAERLEFHDDIERQLTLNHFEPLAVTIAHAIRASGLPRHHGDPFDRMLVAQAAVESLTLVTADVRLKAYGGSMILA
jgi:PIN domain nuclease of toxin-antitoxin system